MDEGLGLVIGILLSAVCVIALFVGLGALFPLTTERARRAAETMPGRSFLVGLINTLFVSVLFFSVQGGGRGLAQVLAILLLSAFSFSLAIGLTAMVQVTAMRLFGLPLATRAVVWSAVVLVLGSLTPFVGWFGLFPYLGLRGLGGFILSWWRRAEPIGAPPLP
jgi:hypothetical protein